MPQNFDKLLAKNKDVIKRIPAARTAVSRYLLKRFPLHLADLDFKPKFTNSYALISEKNSPPFKSAMRHFDAYIGAGFYGPNKYWEYPWALASLQLQPGLNVLDAGCGTSPPQFAMARLGCRVHGADPYQDVEWHGIDRALPGRFGCGIQYRVESIEKLGWPDSYFDRVACISVIEHCRVQKPKNEFMTPLTPDDLALQRRIMRELVRVLRPGGLLVLTTDYYLPRDNCVEAANVNIPNLLTVEGITTAPVPAEGFPGDEGFDWTKLVRNGDIDIVSHADILQTSIGLTLRKL